MKKLLTLLALGSASLLSADPYSCTSCNGGGGGGGGYYQDQSNNGYNQRGRTNQWNDQNNNRNQGADRNQWNDQNNRNQGSDRNQWNDQNNRNQGSNRNQWNDQNNRDQGSDRNQWNDQNNRNQGFDQNRQNNFDNDFGFQRVGDPLRISDRDIAKKVYDALNTYSKVYQDVSFKVRNGNVILRGNVDTIDNKSKAEDAVKKIDGVKQVNNQIVVGNAKPTADADIDASKIQKYEKNFPQDYAATDSDRIVNAKIRDKLNGGWFSKGYETLVLKTTNGVVIISGSVDKPEDIQKINDQLRDIDGVQSVNNQLTVKNK